VSAKLRLAEAQIFAMPVKGRGMHVIPKERMGVIAAAAPRTSQSRNVDQRLGMSGEA
jgi:hypothetical protein